MTRILPAAVATFIDRLDSANSPAFLEVDHRMKLLSSGGALERYSLDALHIGGSVTQQIPMLEGVLDDQRTVQIEHVQWITAHYASIYIFSATDRIWMIFTDTTMRSQEKQQRQQQRLKLALSQELKPGT